MGVSVLVGARGGVRLACGWRRPPHLPRRAAVMSVHHAAAATYASAVAAVYRRFVRQLKAHPRRRVRAALLAEVRHEFRQPMGGSGSDQATARLARSLLALTWLKRATSDPTSGEGRTLYHLVGLRDAVSRRAQLEATKPGYKTMRERRAADGGLTEEALLREVYGPLTDAIGVRGVLGQYWSPPPPPSSAAGEA